MGGSVQRVLAQEINNNETRISGRPNWNPNSNQNAKCTTRPKRRNSPSISNNFVNNQNNFSSKNLSSKVINNLKENKVNKKSIKGLCSIDGKITPFLADSGATTSVLPENLSIDTNLIKFRSKAVTANGAEMKISGVRDCEIQLGNSTNAASLLVSPEAQDELLLGLDFLSNCEITKPHIQRLLFNLDRGKCG